MGNYIKTLVEWLVDETIVYKYNSYARNTELQPTKVLYQQQKPVPQFHQLQHVQIEEHLQQNENQQNQQKYPQQQIAQHQAHFLSTFKIDFDDDWHDFGIFGNDLGHLIYSYVETSKTKELNLLKWARLKLELTEELMRRNLPRHSTPIRSLSDVNGDGKKQNKVVLETRQMRYLRKYRDKLKKLIEHIKAQGNQRMGSRALLRKCAELSGVKMRAYKLKHSRKSVLY